MTSNPTVLGDLKFMFPDHKSLVNIICQCVSLHIKYRLQIITQLYQLQKKIKKMFTEYHSDSNAHVLHLF